MDQLTRRLFLEKVSLTTAAVLVGQAQTVSASEPLEPHIPFPTTPRQRVARASLSSRDYSGAPPTPERNPPRAGRALPQFPPEVPRKFTAHNIEPHSRH